jgi:uroporphyrinogen-III synthase
VVWRNAAQQSHTDTAVFVSLTREKEKNDHLRLALQEKGIRSITVPCIAHAEGPDAPLLTTAFKDMTSFDTVAVSSPESAAVVLKAWKVAGEPQLRVVAVGRATSEVLADGGIQCVTWSPSKANAATLAKELPLDLGMRVLYPTSTLAADTLVTGLEERGFSVQRLSTYSTVPAEWDEEQAALASQTKIVAFASPSAVRIWADRVGVDAHAVCIGDTSAAAASARGFSRVSYADKPSFELWVDKIAEVVSASTAIHPL